MAWFPQQPITPDEIKVTLLRGYTPIYTDIFHDALDQLLRHSIMLLDEHLLEYLKIQQNLVNIEAPGGPEVYTQLIGTIELMSAAVNAYERLDCTKERIAELIEKCWINGMNVEKTIKYLSIITASEL